MFTSVNAKLIKWKVINLELPDSWKTKKRPMPSLGGYYLEAKVKGKVNNFFIHTNKPSIIATKSGSERYFKNYVNGIKKNVKYKCERDTKTMSYKCSSLINKNNKWSLSLMYWYQDKERLLLKLDNLSSRGEAQAILEKIKVGLP